MRSSRNGAITFWVLTRSQRSLKCHAQGHYRAKVGIQPRTSRSGILYSTTTQLRSRLFKWTLSLSHDGHVQYVTAEDRTRNLFTARRVTICTSLPRLPNQVLIKGIEENRPYVYALYPDLV